MPETPSRVRHLSEADLGLFVHKTGRTTEHTQGFVQALFATVTNVKYDLFQKATIVNPINFVLSQLNVSLLSPGDHPSS